ncbi:hypothetical protein ACFPC0_10900 [Streptomyces andamanensis]|uniref:Uncharacterized protein n=1 Tax=Streptomyces andamanensis TaxID=1565035 RepID=A0ABV8TCJ4_9ACTN
METKPAAARPDPNIHADETEVSRHMPVNPEGQATGPTVIIYASGRKQLIAYWAACCGCPRRAPFFSPSDREQWVELHRLNTDHPVVLSTAPWDYTQPPWIAAWGTPLDLPRSYRMTDDAFATFPPGFPRPDWDAATQTRVSQRRAALKRGCPRHPEAGAELSFYKELFVKDADGEGHLPTTAVYDDGCMASWRLDVEADTEPKMQQAPQ